MTLFCIIEDITKKKYKTTLTKRLWILQKVFPETSWCCNDKNFIPPLQSFWWQRGPDCCGSRGSGDQPAKEVPKQMETRIEKDGGQFHWQEPWSSGRRVKSRRLWVLIPVPDTRRTFFTLTCKIGNYCLKRPKINNKRGQVGQFKKTNCIQTF